MHTLLLKLLFEYPGKISLDGVYIKSIDKHKIMNQNLSIYKHVIFVSLCLDKSSLL